MPRPGSHHRVQPQQGICGVCGCRVVEQLRFSHWTVHGHGYEMWSCGHYYDQSGHLQKVRCIRRGGQGFHPNLTMPLAN
jgi:hypothetical protein